MPSLLKRGDVWYSDIRIAGKRVRKPLDTDKRFALQKLDKLKDQAHACKYGNIDPLWLTFKAKYLQWSQGTKAHGTWKRDKSAITALESFKVPKKLSDVTPQLLDHWKAKRKLEGKGAATINRELKAVKAMLRKAMAWGDMPQQVINVQGFKETKGRLIFFTVKQCQDILNRCHGVWETICLLGLGAGLRRSEMYWASRKDFNNGVLSITPKQGWDPKDYKVRHIPTPEYLTKHLNAIKTEWILGDRPSLGVMTTYFRKIVRNAGLKGGIHTLRHSYASHLAQSGVDLYTISELLGHANVKTTQIYAHLIPKTFEAAIAKLPKKWSQSGHSLRR